MQKGDPHSLRHRCKEGYKNYFYDNNLPSIQDPMVFSGYVRAMLNRCEKEKMHYQS